MFKIAILVAAAGLLAACGDADTENAEDEEYAEESSAYEDGDEGLRGGETYQEYDERRDSYGGSYGSFSGDGCTEDCSGHEAGYNWAMERGIDDPDNCGGKSWSFEEGCRAYAEEQGG